MPPLSSHRRWSMPIPRLHATHQINKYVRLHQILESWNYFDLFPTCWYYYSLCNWVEVSPRPRQGSYTDHLHHTYTYIFTFIIHGSIKAINVHATIKRSISILQWGLQKQQLQLQQPWLLPQLLLHFPTHQQINSINSNIRSIKTEKYKIMRCVSEWIPWEHRLASASFSAYVLGEAISIVYLLANKLPTQHNLGKIEEARMPWSGWCLVWSEVSLVYRVCIYKRRRRRKMGLMVLVELGRLRPLFLSIGGCDMRKEWIEWERWGERER